MVIKNPAPHDVEEGVGKMAGIGEGILRALKAIGGSHQLDQGLCACFNVGGEGVVEAAAAGQCFAEGDHLRLRLVDLGHNAPAFGARSRELHFCRNEIGAFFALHIRFLHQRRSCPEIVELEAGKQVNRLIKTHRPGHIRLEGFARLGLVHDDGAQGKHAQTRAGLQLAALVGVHQVAGGLLHLAWHAVGHDVLQAIQHGHSQFRIRCIHQLCRPHKPKALAAAPAVAENQAQVVVDFFKQNLVAVDAFVEVPRHGIQPRLPRRKRFPQPGAAFAMHLKQGFAAGQVR